MRMRPSIPFMSNPKHILLFRADAIGDHVLASGLLPLIRAAWPEARITVLCPAFVADLFRACDLVHRVIAFDPAKVRGPLERLRLRWNLDRRYDVAVHTAHARSLLGDFLARQVRADRLVGFRGEPSNQNEALLRRHDRAYTELVEAHAEPRHALDWLDLMASHLGLVGSVQPAAWVSKGDRVRAEALLSELPPGLDRIAFFPGSGTAIRRYGGYGEALRAFLVSRPAAVVALGSEADRAWVDEILSDLPGTASLNLCGRTTLPEAAALLQRCRLATGAESGLAHLAWAVGTPQAAVVGGGHFGAFLPRARLTAAACLPLSCFGCGWDCRFERPHCIQDLPHATLAAAMTAAWDGPSDRPRIFHPVPHPLPALASTPPPLPSGRSARIIEVRDPA